MRLLAEVLETGMVLEVLVFDEDSEVELLELVALSVVPAAEQYWVACW